MKNKKYTVSKNTKFVSVNNSTWIEADACIPDEVARVQFLQKMELTKSGTFSGRNKSENIAAQS